MDLNQYQAQAIDLAIYPDKGHNIVYPVLGLTGEAGEVAEHAKKMLRDEKGLLTDTRRADMIKELGDVLWYVAALAHELSVSLDTVATKNIEKLNDRRIRGVIHGSGSNR